MNQDELKDIKSDRSLSTRKILSSSQVPPKTILFYVLLGIVFFAALLWVYFGVSSQQENLIKMNQRLISLEENIQSSSELSEETIQTVLQDIKLINKEIRKLWDLSNKRNKVNIQKLTEQSVEIEKLLDEIQINIKNNQDNIYSLRNNIDLNISKLDSLQLNASDLNILKTNINSLDTQLILLDDSVQALNNYKNQLNQVILEIQTDISIMQLPPTQNTSDQIDN